MTFFQFSLRKRQIFYSAKKHLTLVLCVHAGQLYPMFLTANRVNISAILL